MSNEQHPTAQSTLDAASEMRRIRNQIRQSQAEATLNRQTRGNTMVTRAHLRHDLQLARQARQIRELPFESPTPVIGAIIVRFRTLWNNIACKWHVRRILAQQNDYNRLIYSLLSQLVSETDRMQTTIEEQAAMILELEQRFSAKQTTTSSQTPARTNSNQD